MLGFALFLIFNLSVGLVGYVHFFYGRCTPTITETSGTHAPTGTICSGDLIFEDNFDELDLEIWNHAETLTGGGNWEFQWYTNSRYNSYVDEGVLHIKPTLLTDYYSEDVLWSGTLDLNGNIPVDQCTDPSRDGCHRTGTETIYLNPVKSALMRTVYSFSFKFGKAEVRAKLPAGDWLWPAIWFMPRYNQYSGWPASGEIDLMEGRGNRNLTNIFGANIGTHLVSSTLHWGPNWRINRWWLTHVETYNSSGFDTDWHRYQMIWTEKDISFSIDDQILATYTPPDGGFWEWGNLNSSGYKNPWKGSSKMAPFDQKFYIILNMAIGGSAHFPDYEINPGGKPWVNKDSQEMYTEFWKGKEQWLPTWKLDTDSAAFKIDYVRIWAL